MIISELISRLQTLLHVHGDIRCVTPGFDESEFDDIETVDIVWVHPCVRAAGHRGQHDEVDASAEGAEKAVEINF